MIIKYVYYATKNIPRLISPYLGRADAARSLQGSGRVTLAQFFISVNIILLPA